MAVKQEAAAQRRSGVVREDYIQAGEHCGEPKSAAGHAALCVLLQYLVYSRYVLGTLSDMMQMGKQWAIKGSVAWHLHGCRECLTD